MQLFDPESLSLTFCLECMFTKNMQVLLGWFDLNMAYRRSCSPLIYKPQKAIIVNCIIVFCWSENAADFLSILNSHDSDCHSWDCSPSLTPDIRIFSQLEFVWEWKIKDVLWNPITLLRPYSAESTLII